MEQLLENVRDYVMKLLQETLSPELHFHNVNHTLEVVAASQEIGAHCGLSADEMNVLVTAAWFHDTGYSKIYIGHEAISKAIADDFLKKHNCDQKFIDVVLDAIEATKFPQLPKSLIEEVLCDADLYHFTRPDYPRYATAIRSEFETFMGKIYSDDDWKKINCKMLTLHNYFTSYGKDVLTKFKEVNIKLMDCNVE